MLEVFSIQVKSLRLIGFERREWAKYPKITNIEQVFCIINMIHCIVLTVWYVIEKFRDLLEAADASGVLIGFIIGFSKFMTLYASKDKFFALMDSIKCLADGGKYLDGIK